MIRIAIVFGHSEQGTSLATQLLTSFYKHIYTQSNKNYQIDVYPYLCNFKITNRKKYFDALNFPKKEASRDSYAYSKPTFKYWHNYIQSFNTWPGKFYPINCTDKDFEPHALPDVAVYHDFDQKYADKYEYILYCHDDIVFIHNERDKRSILDLWTSRLAYKTEYSIITEARLICDKNISMRFHLAFVLVNMQKFRESQLSFINDYILVQEKDFWVYGNGGSQFFASFYKKREQPLKWRPYLIDTHGVFPPRPKIKKEKWFDHLMAVDWNRDNPGPLGNPQRSIEIYKKAEEYTKKMTNSLKF